MGEIDIDLDDTNEVYKEVVKEPKPQKSRKKEITSVNLENNFNDMTDEVKSCLVNKKVYVKFIPKNYMGIANPKHILYGGMAENSVIILTVPVLSSTGTYKNVLTKDEKKFLEEFMGLEYDALSIYKKKDNYWDNFIVRLTKQGIVLDLSDPNDYVKYKVLKANNDIIADSLETLRDKPRPTYKFYMTVEDEETAIANDNMTAIMKCYKEFGKYESDYDTLKCVVELIEGKPLSSNIKLDAIKAKVNTLIQERTKEFLKTITDDYLSEIVLIKKALASGVIAKRGDYYYLASDNKPLCNNNENPVLSTVFPDIDEIKNGYSSNISRTISISQSYNSSLINASNISPLVKPLSTSLAITCNNCFLLNLGSEVGSYISLVNKPFSRASL